MNLNQKIDMTYVRLNGAHVHYDKCVEKMDIQIWQDLRREMEKSPQEFLESYLKWHKIKYGEEFCV